MNGKTGRIESDNGSSSVYSSGSSGTDTGSSNDNEDFKADKDKYKEGE